MATTVGEKVSTDDTDLDPETTCRRKNRSFRDFFVPLRVHTCALLAASRDLAYTSLAVCLCLVVFAFVGYLTFGATSNKWCTYGGAMLELILLSVRPHTFDPGPADRRAPPTPHAAPALESHHHQRVPLHARHITTSACLCTPATPQPSCDHCTVTVSSRTPATPRNTRTRRPPEPHMDLHRTIANTFGLSYRAFVYYLLFAAVLYALLPMLAAAWVISYWVRTLHVAS